VITLAWKISHNALATQLNLKRRGIVTSGMCLECGKEDEDTFHAFMRCPHPRNLWNAMKEVWDLPPDSLLEPTGLDWLIHLLSAIPENQ
jgi:hypothetical protein